MVMVKAVIFDVDGTLLDSVDLHAHAWQDAFREFGHDVPFGDIRRQIGKGGDQLLPVFLDQAELAAKGKAMEERRGELFKERYLGQVRGFPGVRALFERLKADGIERALASSSKKDELETYERIAGIEDLVSVQTSTDDAEKSKPSPDIFEAALKRLHGVDPRQVIVVGDTPYDAEAASKAGLRTVGVRCGGWSEAELRDAGCIAVYDDPADLLAQYARSPLAG